MGENFPFFFPTPRIVYDSAVLHNNAMGEEKNGRKRES